MVRPEDVPSMNCTANTLICRGGAASADATEGMECQTSSSNSNGRCPSIVPRDIPSMSDDECMDRLAQAIADHDSDKLAEVAQLIGRLAVAIE